MTGQQDENKESYQRRYMRMLEKNKVLEARLCAMNKVAEQASKTADKLAKWSDTLIQKQLKLQQWQERLTKLDETLVLKQAQENEVSELSQSSYKIDWKWKKDFYHCAVYQGLLQILKLDTD